MSRRRIQPKVSKGSPEAMELLQEVHAPQTDWEAVAQIALQQRDAAVATLNLFANLQRSQQMLREQVQHSEEMARRLQDLLPLVEKFATLLEQAAKERL